jgi:hypothetical protein
MGALARFLQSLRLLHWSRAALFLGLIALACLSRVLGIAHRRGRPGPPARQHARSSPCPPHDD